MYKVEKKKRRGKKLLLIKKFPVGEGCGLHHPHPTEVVNKWGPVEVLAGRFPRGYRRLMFYYYGS